MVLTQKKILWGRRHRNETTEGMETSEKAKKPFLAHLLNIHPGLSHAIAGSSPSCIFNFQPDRQIVSHPTTGLSHLQHMLPDAILHTLQSQHFSTVKDFFCTPSYPLGLCKKRRDTPLIHSQIPDQLLLQHFHTSLFLSPVSSRSHAISTISARRP